MRVLLLTFMVLTFTLQNQVAKAEGGNKEIVGTWNYEAPNAPEGFTTGTFVITEKNKQLGGLIRLQDGEEIEFGTVEYADGKLTVTFLVDYNTVTISAEVKDKKMTGSVSTPDGDIEVTAVKVKGKKSKK
ncbi:MAG: hypothetical protein U0W24_02535 [Bacteroidales bacterium]